MEKRRKTMCDTCIYRTGELTRNRIKHPCHEHFVGGVKDETVVCAGSCKPKGMELITSKTPNGDKWKRSLGYEAANTAIRNLLSRGFGKQKMSDAVRLHKISKGHINTI